MKAHLGIIDMDGILQAGALQAGLQGVRPGGAGGAGAGKGGAGAGKGGAGDDARLGCRGRSTWSTR